MSFFKRLKDGLFKTSTKISEGVKNVFVRRRVDAETLEDLEDILITADLGMEVTQKILDEIKAQKYEKNVEVHEIQRIMAEVIEKTLMPLARSLDLSSHKESPKVIMMVGVNGSGKTTTLAKYAEQFKKQNKKITLIAADTFRAAATSQLEVWAKRIDVTFFKGRDNADPASVVFEGFRDHQDADIIMIDTAGRLQNKAHLMEELKKMERVLKKQGNHFPHETILVLDATTGQNALQQVEVFSKTIPLTGLIMTKLDGTAKGGIIVAIAEKYTLPIYAIGMGEGFDDLHPFDAHAFALNLVGLDESSFV